MKGLSQEQKTLIEKLVGQEAKHTGLGPARLYSYIGNHVKSKNNLSTEKTRKKIYDSFDGEFDINTVRKYMLNFIDVQIEIAGEFNPSFQALKEIIEKGQYDFDFSKYAGNN